MRILYIAKMFWPEIPAGAIAAEIATRVVGRGHTVELLLPNVRNIGFEAKRGFLPPKGLTIQYLGPRLSRLLADTVSCSFLLLRGISAAFKADVVLSQHHPSNLVSFFSAIVAFVTRRPLVVRAEDVIKDPQIGTVHKLATFVIRCCTIWALRRARFFLVNSKELAEWSYKAYGLEKGNIGVSHNGVDTKKFSSMNRRNELRDRFASKHILIFSGSLDAIGRRLDIVLRATVILKRMLPDVKVLIMGGGPNLGRLVEITESLKVEKSVIFLGRIEPDLVPPYLASADIGIGPLEASIQTYGTNPVKVLEYMASGCVVIAGKNTVSSDVLTDELNGILIKAGAVDLAASVLKVFSDPDLAARLKARARETVETSYDWEKVVSELLLYLDSAARANRIRTRQRG